MLSQPVTTIKGVGTVLAGKLHALGVETVEDLLYFFPRTYDDYSNVVPIAGIRPGPVTVKGVIESITGRHIRRGLHITEAVIADATAKTRAVWFNQPYRTTQLAKGGEYLFSGTYGMQRNRYILQNPAAEQAAGFGVNTARIVPIYPGTAGLKQHQVRKVMHELMPVMAMLPETLPPPLVQQEKLLDINETLQNLHFPRSSKLLEAAKKRIAFEELLPLLLASQLNKQDQAAMQAWPIAFSAQTARQFTASLPFTMTDGQRKAAWEICQDIAKGQPMNRLLQGDVGSGKTAVAAMALFMAAKAGLQTAFMAPTELLAAQHARTIADLLEPLGVRVALLVGSTNTKAKQELKRRLAVGEIDIIVGTHAIIQKDVVFHALGMAVIDEQHRFGVAQRQQLLTHGTRMPHLLSMTATPIPRSLQLTVYGELDVSVLHELPKGRQPIATKVVSPQARHHVYEHIDKEVAKGRQAYVVCPVVAEGADAELKSVEVEHQRLLKSVFKHRRLGLLHGQLKAPEKERVMKQFKNAELDVLVCTTVIEVGVDVPNATVMLIEGAERFGLAQLHQLRGRVGRGGVQSFCFLVPTTAQAVSQRLREMESSNDGFYLAQVDLELRGPGAIYGRMQHGELDLSFANLADTSLLARVQRAAKQMLSGKVDLLQYKRLNEHVNRYRRLTKLN